MKKVSDLYNGMDKFCLQKSKWKQNSFSSDELSLPYLLWLKNRMDEYVSMKTRVEFKLESQFHGKRHIRMKLQLSEPGI